MRNNTLTNELRRIIKCLYEACEESNITVTEAIDLFESEQQEKKAENLLTIVPTNVPLSFEERASNFVVKANLPDPTHTKVATEVLTFFHQVLNDTQNPPSQEEVINHMVEEKILLTKTHAKTLILRACSSLIFKSGGNRTCYEKLNWKQITNYFVLWAKSI